MKRLLFLLGLVLVMNSCDIKSELSAFTKYTPPPSIEDIELGMTKGLLESKFSLSASNRVLIGREKDKDEQDCSTYRYKIKSGYYILTFCNDKLTKWQKDLDQRSDTKNDSDPR